MAGKSNPTQKAETWARYQAQIKSHGHVAPLPDQEYTGSTAKLYFRCLVHPKADLWHASPLRAAEGRLPPCCNLAGMQTRAAEKKAKKGAEYNRLLKQKGLKVTLAFGSVYDGNHTKIDHYCLNHHEVWPARPSNVLRDHGLKCCKTGGKAKRRSEIEAMAAKRGIAVADLVVGDGVSASYFDLNQVPPEWHELPKSRAEAIAAGQLYCFTGEPCVHGHYALRYCNPNQKGDACCACRNHSARRWADDNPEHIQTKSAEYYAKNRELLQAKSRAWNNANRERANRRSRAWRRAFVRLHGCDPATHRAKEDPAFAQKLREKSTRQSRNWRQNNPEAARARARAGTAAWRRRNPDKVAAANVFRNRNYFDAFREMTPSEKQRTLAIYKVRDKINGASHLSAGARIAEVDHIFPLVQGGAHHPDNLLVVTTAANRFWGGKVKACPWPRPADWNEPAWEINTNE